MTTAVRLEDNEARQQYLDVEEYFGEKQLRWVQIAVRNALAQALTAGIRTNLIVQPTGSGKTITIACSLGSDMIKQALGVSGRPLRIVFIAHLHRLLTQAERTFAEDNSVDLRLHTPHTDIPDGDFEWCDAIVMDEAHHEAMMSVQLQLSKMIHKPLIGLTATPDRADGMVIKFENIIEPCTREEAVAEGWLAETSLWSFVDTSGRDKTSIVKQIVNQYHGIMGGTLVFMRTKNEARVICAHIADLGYRVVFLDTQTPDEMNTILDDFSRGEYDFIINCNRLGEGVDVTGCVSVILGKTVGSYPLLNQVVGRAARPDSDCQIFELVNPLSGRNLDTSVVVGTPTSHLLCSPQRDGTFRERQFDYTGIQDTGIVSHTSTFLR